MIKFTTTILQFNEQAEKTGWTYIKIPAALAQQLKPGNRKSFRIKGKLDDYAISGISLMPMGGGDFIMAVNAAMRKGIKKRNGAQVTVELQVDLKPVELNAELLECLQDEPEALEYFNRLNKSHQKYFSDWIIAAKTETTKTRRIAQAINALSKKLDFGQLLRNLRDDNRDLLA